MMFLVQPPFFFSIKLGILLAQFLRDIYQAQTDYFFYLAQNLVDQISILVTRIKRMWSITFSFLFLFFLYFKKKIGLREGKEIQLCKMQVSRFVVLCCGSWIFLWQPLLIFPRLPKISETLRQVLILQKLHCFITNSECPLLQINHDLMSLHHIESKEERDIVIFKYGERAVE